ncbi:MAG: amidohydrolase family protein [Bacteroidia bacterium]|nr:amidohydrolase family protein [Bacteroidia bacterium]
MLRKFSADYIFPVSSPPIQNGIVVTDEQGRILEISAPSSPSPLLEERGAVQHFNGIIVPGFVNAHCHLELSFLKNKIPENKGLDEFILAIETQRLANEEDIFSAARDAEQEMLSEGMVAVGDISNKNHSFGIKVKSDILFHTFIEVFGFHPARAEEVFNRGLILKGELERLDSKFIPIQLGQSSITAHASYSASSQLLKKIRENAEAHNSVLTIHNQETEDENFLFQNKTGKILQRLEKFGIDTSFFVPTGKNSLSSVIPFLPKKNKIQLVHNTFTTETDIDKAIAHNKNIFWCFCPNANLYIENRLPDIKMFYDKKLKCTIGTDSLASNYQLSVLEEMKTIQKKFPSIPLEEIIRWATLNGAELLGFNQLLGSIEKNKTPGLVFISAVDLPSMLLTEKSKATRLI